jgi:glycerol-3-phosphate dehydrogenase
VPIAVRKCDVLVVGGGIAGTGVARDLALRGADTILVEKEDFGSGTTSKSSRLIHGGLRYLETMEFGLVREGLKERETLLHIAPHLVKPLMFAMPVYENSRRGKTILGAALTAYDMLSYGKSLPNHSYISRGEALKILPYINEKGLKGAFTYFDAQADMVERLCLENALDAEAHGAIVLNHTALNGLKIKDRKIIAASIYAEDGNISVIEPSVIINATGPWLDIFLRDKAGIEGRNMTTTKGVHIISEGDTNCALVINSHEDGRVMFVIPWMGRLLIGTTDTKFEGKPEDATARISDVRYILDKLERYAPGIRIDESMAYSGLRPLARKDVANPSKISRNYKIIDHSAEGIENMVSIAGSKITEYRSMSEKVGDIVSKILGIKSKSYTAETPLLGSGLIPPQPGWMGDASYDKLISLYGSRAEGVIEIAGSNPRLREKICQHNADILAEVQFSVREEHATTLQDFMLRRSGIGYSACMGIDGLDKAAREMASILGWSQARTEREKQEYIAYIGASTLIRN